MSRRVRFSCIAALLTLQTGLLAFSAHVHSPTLLEPAQLAAGIAVWKYGRFDLFNVNPPLVRMIAAVPALASDATVEDDWYTARNRPLYAPTVGNDFIHANGGWRSFRYFTMARWACIPFVLAGGLVCYHWARELFGVAAGLTALSLWSLDPNILGHGSLITNDIPAAALGLWASYGYWRWLRVRSWRRASVAGLALGCALLAKLTWIPLLGLWPALWVWSLVRGRRVAKHDIRLRLGLELAQLSMIAVAAFYLVNLCYAFDGTWTRLRDFNFVSEALSGRSMSERPGNRFSESWLGSLPIPLPRQYVAGADAQWTDFEHYRSPSYLRGEWKQGGWWWYYAYGLLTKSPHGTQAMVLLSAVVAISHAIKAPARAWRRALDVAALLIPGIAVFTLASCQTAFSHHVRYVWPCLGMLIVFGASLAASPSAGLRAVALSFAVLSGASSLRVFPHEISYFNELAGGPSAAGGHLLHSNVDWGQDLCYLRTWCHANPEARPLFVACVSAMRLADAGLPFAPPPLGRNGDEQSPELAPGWYAVSVNYLRGAGWGTPHGAYGYFGDRKPFGRLSYSILLYRVRKATIPKPGVRSAATAFPRRVDFWQHQPLRRTTL